MNEPWNDFQSPAATVQEEGPWTDFDRKESAPWEDFSEPVTSPSARASFGPPGENPEGVVRSGPSNLLEMEANRIAPKNPIIPKEPAAQPETFHGGPFIDESGNQVPETPLIEFSPDTLTGPIAGPILRRIPGVGPIVEGASRATADLLTTLTTPSGAAMIAGTALAPAVVLPEMIKGGIDHGFELIKEGRETGDLSKISEGATILGVTIAPVAHLIPKSKVGETAKSPKTPPPLPEIKTAQDAGLNVAAEALKAVKNGKVTDFTAERLASEAAMLPPEAAPRQQPGIAPELEMTSEAQARLDAIRSEADASMMPPTGNVPSQPSISPEMGIAATVPKAKRGKGRTPAQEFDDLVAEYGEIEGWGIDLESSASKKAAAKGPQSGASIKGKFNSRDNTTAAARIALGDIGAKDTDLYPTAANKAKFLPNLKEYLAKKEAERNAPDTLPDDIGYTPTPGIEDPFAQPPEAPLPKLRAGEKQGDVFANQKEDFALVGEKATDAQKVAEAKAKAERDAAEAKRIQDEQQQDLFGQGPGAALGGEGSEILQTSENTGIKKDSVNAQRELRGEEPLQRGASQSWDKALDEAKAKMETESTWIADLEKELTDNPRPMDTVETAGMLTRLTELRKEYDAASDMLSKAKEAGESTDALNQRIQSISDQTSRLEQAVSIGGAASESGRSLNALKMMMKQDFTLAAMERKIRNSRDGAPLTEAEHIQLRKDFEEIKGKLEVEEQKSKKAQDDYLDAELNRVKAEAKAEQSKQPEYHPSILEHAEKFVVKMEEISRGYAREIFGQFNSPTPDVLAKAAFIGATKLARIGLDVTRWTAEMVKELGPGFEKFAAQVLEASKKILADRISESEKSPTAPKIAKAVNRPTNVVEKIEAEKSKIAAKVEKNESGEIGPNIDKLVRAIVERDPRITRDGLTDSVHDVLKEFIPGITREEVMDAISGRGKFTLPKQDFVSKIVRDLKQQLRLVGHALDVVSGKPLPKTGPQRDPMSDAARGLQRQLTELMRKYGVKVTDPAKQLASTLNARKTFYRHRIADLTQEISTKERIVKSKSPSPTDAELEGLRAELKELQIEEKKVFPKEKISEEDQLKLAIEGAKKNEARWNERLARAEKGDLSSGKTPGRKVTSPELEAIKARVEHAKNAVKELKDLANPKLSPEEIALRSFMTRQSNEKAKYLEKIAAGDFSKPKRVPFDISKYPEAMKAKAEADAVKNAWLEKRHQEQLRLRTLPRKIWDGIKQAAGIPANLVTSVDFSAPRQGMVAILSLSTRPVKGWPIIVRSMGEYFSSAFSEKRAEVIEAKRKSRLNAINGVDKISKVDFVELNQTKFTPREDYARSILDQWAKIPFKTGNTAKTIATAVPKALVKAVRGSNRGFITFLNSVRASELDLLLKINFKDRAPTDIEVRDIGNAVNMSTGRGNMSPMTSKVLGGGLWSPNLFMNRLKTMAGQPLLHPGSLRTKRIVAEEYARVIGSAYILYKIGGMFDEKQEESKTSSDYAKIVRGDVRLDIGGGYQQWTVLFNRFKDATTTTIKGETKDIGADKKFGDDGLFVVGGRFLRSKANPLAGAGIDIATRTDFLGNPTTIGGVVGNLTVPLSFKEIGSIMTENGFTEGMILEAMQLFGAGVSVYDDQRKP